MLESPLRAAANISEEDLQQAGSVEETTYVSSTESPTDRPLPTDLIHYYSYRVTISSEHRVRLKNVLFKYSKNFIFGNHGGHGEDGQVGDDVEKLHHFHCIILDFDHKKVDTFKKAMSKEFDRRGNGFHAGKFMDNTVYKGIQYIKHESGVDWTFRGGHWPDIIADSPDWEHREPKKERLVQKPKLSWPVLTYSNVLKQAYLWRQEHKLSTTDLGLVLEHMTKNSKWQPDIRIMRTGLDEMHFKLFKYRCDPDGSVPNWWQPKAEATYKYT